MGRSDYNCVWEWEWSTDHFDIVVVTTGGKCQRRKLSSFQQVDFEVVQGVPSVLWLTSCYWPVISAHHAKNNAKPRLTRAPTTSDCSPKDRSLVHKAKCFAIINFIYLLILLLLLFYRTENSFSFSVCVFSARINIKAVGLCLTSLRCVWLVAVVHLSIEISIWTCSRNSQSLGPTASR